MPENPHEYTLRKHWDNDDDFAEAVQLIRDYGYVTKFKGRKYTQFNVLGHFYWSMGAPIPETILINRACIDKDVESPYDAISEYYDCWFSEPKYKQEDNELIRLLNPYINGRTLDIGCGTGILIDLTKISSDNYRGIDSSRLMLDKLKSKHPGYRVLQTRYEDFMYEGFDTIVSLYGSFNYCNPLSISNILEQLKKGGKYFLMLYKDDYIPIINLISNINIPYNKTVKYKLPVDSEKTDFNNYIIVTGVKS